MRWVQKTVNALVKQKKTENAVATMLDRLHAMTPESEEGLRSMILALRNTGNLMPASAVACLLPLLAYDLRFTGKVMPPPSVLHVLNAFRVAGVVPAPNGFLPIIPPRLQDND